MAAGQVHVSRRRDYYGYSQREIGHHKDGANGCRTSSGVIRSSYRRTDVSVRKEGSCQLSREKSSVDSSRLEDGEIPTGVQPPPQKKRKFSPIVWNKQDKGEVISSKNKVTVSLSAAMPNHHSLRGDNGKGSSTNHVGEVLEVSVPSEESPELRSASDEEAVLQGLEYGLASDSPSKFSFPLNKGSQQTSVQGQGHGDAEGLLEARNISKCRWASGCDDLSDDEMMPKADEPRKSSSPFSGIEMGSAGSDRDAPHKIKNVVNGDDCYLDELSSDDESGCTEEPVVNNQRGVNMLDSCRSVFEYERLNAINEGTYGKVFKAKDKKSGEIVAVKMIKMDKRVVEDYGFPVSSLREINILFSFQHPSIVEVKEVAMDDRDNVYMVMEYMEHDLKELMKVMKQPFSTSEVKCLMLQLLAGLKYLHDNWVIHRDLKTSNLLFNNQGELKICDFGMSRRYGSPLKPYTSGVVTLWYRAPELLLAARQYSTAVDMWSVGCIMAELLGKEPIFNGTDEIKQLKTIFGILGTPNENIWPGLSKLPGAKAKFSQQPYNLLRKKFPARSITGSPVLSDLGYDLLSRLLTYDPEKRITADAALNHPWFKEVPLPKSRDFMPTFPPQTGKAFR
ncbi:Cyclin-dependent kinase G-2 [Linum perenne]